MRSVDDYRFIQKYKYSLICKTAVQATITRIVSVTIKWTYTKGAKPLRPPRMGVVEVDLRFGPGRLFGPEDDPRFLSDVLVEQFGIRRDGQLPSDAIVVSGPV